MTGLTMQEFADRCHVGLTTVNYWENVIAKGLSERGAKKVVDAIKIEGIECSLLWLMEGKGEPPRIVDPSKLTKLNQGLTEISIPLSSPVETKIVNLDEDLQEELKVFQKFHPNSLIATIVDDAMLPFYKVGDLVGGKRLEGVNMELANGLDCIVDLGNKELIVRRIKLGSSTGTFNLYCSNLEATVENPVLNNIKIVALAPVVRVWRKIKF
jgi:transcriptional regulator with XRE-family HTH domain